MKYIFLSHLYLCASTWAYITFKCIKFAPSFVSRRSTVLFAPTNILNLLYPRAFIVQVTNGHDVERSFPKSFRFSTEQ